LVEHWFKEAVIYCVDVETFVDSNGDGWGDFQGLISRLDHLARLGVTTLWLNPIHPTPNRDDGYDVTDYYSVSSRLGSLGDFVELLHEAANVGIRVMIDLVVNHTSDQHPWFRSACNGPSSQYHDWYVWSRERPPDLRQGIVFPHHQATTWSRHRGAGAWYYHRFYDFEPDLNIANPDVRREILRIMSFWLQLGVAGFRMDAAPFVIELTEPSRVDSPRDYEFLRALREHAAWRRGDSVILAEANVARAELDQYFGDGNRLQMLFDFALNQKVFLALARRDATPLREHLRDAPSIPRSCQWATFLRNHDEVDLSGLTSDERDEVFAAFGPRPRMQIYDRGIRRRLAPMLEGDRRRIELAYSLQFSLPGTPVIRYGEEIGMGENLVLPERDALRTPMQWNATANGGFSSATRSKLVRPVISRGEYSFRKVNVTEQQRDPGSLLTWMERAIHTLRECREFGTAAPRVIAVQHAPSVLALAYAAGDGAMLAVHNLGRHGVTVDLGPQPEQQGKAPTEVFSDGKPDRHLDKALRGLTLGPYGYRWIRLR
jgi:maltose alpha-D-glucosyltransferase / alpha-amylase